MDILDLALERFGRLEPKPVPVHPVEDYRRAFDDVCSEIAEVDPEGTRNFLNQNYTSLQIQISEASDELAETWGKDFDAFNAALRQYKTLMLEAVRRFQEFRGHWGIGDQN
jgi:hypothetical protein